MIFIISIPRVNLGVVRQNENSLWSFAPHDISVVLMLINDEPIEVVSTGQSFLQPGIEDVEVRDVYYIRAQITKEQTEIIASELLCDPVIEEYYLSELPDHGAHHIQTHGFEILYNPGVTDPKEGSVKKAIADLGIKIDDVKTATYYIFKGKFDEQKIKDREHK